MKHLIPYRQEDQKAADYVRQLRWPNGITCPCCGSAVVEPRARCDNGLQRFTCVHCAALIMASATPATPVPGGST
jgi:transposase-like protein